MVFKCSIGHCQNTSATIKTHCLPKDTTIRHLWCQALHRNDLMDVSDRKRHNFRVCDVHFAEDAKFPTKNNRTNIKYNAVPTLHLEEKIFESPTLSTSTAHNTNLPTDDGHHNPNYTVEEVITGTCLEEIRFAAPPPSTSTESRCPIATTNDPETPVCTGSLSKIKLLKTVGVTRASALTPKAHKLYRIAKDMKKIARRLQFQNLSNRERISEAVAYSESKDFFNSKVNKRALNFINSQIKMLEKRARGRRFTFEDKVFALTLLKQGPKAYRALRSTFALPSRKTLMSLLSKIHFQTGINIKIINVIAESIRNLDPLDRHCSLMFDEMSLEPGLTYDKKWDTVIGFQDIDGERSMIFADHVLVFMIQGLRKKWKQPISFHFSQGGMKSDQLKVLIKSTVFALQNIGVTVACTVCDQFSANVTAINKLKEDSPRSSLTYLDLFEIGGQEIVAIYDPPHLLKGIRNILLSHNLKFDIDGVQKEASWDHIVKLYELDEGDFNTRMCYKLTDGHIYKDKLKKMKVKHAAQVFSHRVSSTMRWTVKHGAKELLPKAAEETADFLSFMDQVFDSVNGSTMDASHGKSLKCAVKDDSPHLEFWMKAIAIFKSFKSKTSKGEKVQPSIKNWVKTLRGLIFLWDKLSHIGFKYLCLRRINQDPLENFFGCIRNGVRNINPTPYSFISSFKTLIVNSFSSSHTANFKCEEDEGDILSSLHCLLREVEDNAIGIEHDQDDPIVEDIEFKNTENINVLATHSYIAGYIARHIKNKIGGCATCMNQLQASHSSEEHSFISELEYSQNRLIKTKNQFRRMFSNMISLYLHCVKKIILKNKLNRNLSGIFEKKLFNPFLCQTHNLFQIYVQLFLNFFTYTYLKNINSILKGNTQYNIKDNDTLKNLAWKRHLSLKSKNKKILLVKQLTQ